MLENNRIARSNKANMDTFAEDCLSIHSKFEKVDEKFANLAKTYATVSTTNCMKERLNQLCTIENVN